MLIVWMMLAFGVGFEFPVLLVALQLIGVLTPRQLLGWWRMATVIIVLAAAIITPSGDPIRMLALAVPMFLLYFISIAIGAFALKMRRRKARRTAASVVTGPARAGASASTGSRSRRSRPSTGAARCSSARPPVRARRSSPSTPSPSPVPAGGRAFYTTPIKALSNQKYHDLVGVHGADAVGLLTGDNAVNGDAPDRGDDHRGAPQHDLQPRRGARRAAVA